MHAWEAIQKAVDSIEAHLSEDLSIEQLSMAAHLSSFYFQRLFSRLVGRPVREYIRLRRLARAAEMLMVSDRRILDTALDCGFGSHETLTRAFKEAYGLTPEQYRRDPVRLSHFDKPALLLHYVMVEEGVPLITEGIVLEMNRRTLEQDEYYLGFTGQIPIASQFPVGEVTGVDMPGTVWDHFHAEKFGIPGRIPGGPEIGVSSPSDSPGCFSYFAGAQVEPCGNTGEFDTYTLPAGRYVVCTFEAENFGALVTTAIDRAVRYMGRWMEAHGTTGDHWGAERYLVPSPDATCMELWARVVGE